MERFNLRLLIKAGAAILLFCSSAAFAGTAAADYQKDFDVRSAIFQQLYGGQPELLSPAGNASLSLPLPSLPAERVVSSKDPPIENLGTILNGAYYRGGKLEDEEAYMFLNNRLRVTTVISLRYSKRDDERLCRKYRLNCLYRGVKITIRKFDHEAFREAFRTTVRAGESGERVYIHCAHGSDRTGAMAAAITIRANACHRPFNKTALWNEIDADLEKHKFHSIYRSLYKSIKSWVYNFENNQWICR